MPVTTEQVDAVAGRVRMSGHLTRQGVDLLRGTVECLGRQGHTRVVVDMAAVASADDGTLDDVRALGRPTADGRVTVVMVDAVAVDEIGEAAPAQLRDGWTRLAQGNSLCRTSLAEE